MIKKAELNELGKVINIAVFSTNSNDQSWIEYNDSNPAFMGGDYVDGYFYPPQPFASWTRNNGNWEPPTPRPVGIRWDWDEASVSWVKIV